MPPLRRYTSPLRTAVRVVAQRALLKPFVWSLLDVEVIGQEHVADFSGPAVIAPNHSSDVDTPLVRGALPVRLGVRAATGAAEDRFFRTAKWRQLVTGVFFNTFPIDRSGRRGRNQMVSLLLDAGVPILIYPEGTRSRTGRMGPFKAGSAALSISRNAPFIPVAVIGTFEAMPTGKAFPKPGRPKVKVVIAPPIYPEPGETPRTLIRRVADTVRAMYDEHAPTLGLPTQAERDRLAAEAEAPRAVASPPDEGENGRNDTASEPPEEQSRRSDHETDVHHDGRPEAAD